MINRRTVERTLSMTSIVYGGRREKVELVQKNVGLGVETGSAALGAPPVSYGSRREFVWAERSSQVHQPPRFTSISGTFWLASGMRHLLPPLRRLAVCLAVPVFPKVQRNSYG